MDEILTSKNIRDFNPKHFSRYGEFLVSFELTKYGWNIYSPIYDEYIDLIAHKFTCKKCNALWNVTPELICSKCHKNYSKSTKSSIIAKKICGSCSHTEIGNNTKCPKCTSDMIPTPTCPNCKAVIEMIEHTCSCGHTEYNDKIKTIQVKSSRIEKRPNGKSKNTYAVDMKPRDMIVSKNHFFIWCLIDDSVDPKGKPNFLIMSVNDFKETMGDSIKGTSFFKDQDRQHFSSKNFGKWNKFKDQFSKLE